MKINRCKSLFCSFKQALKNIKNTHAFTLLEIIAAIVIIGALLAFALPKYELTLAKSRFSTLMPITKSIKDSEEVYYVASGRYTDDLDSLPVKTHTGETVQVTVHDDEDYSYIQAVDPRIDNIYKVYFKNSTNFPEERHCEAPAGNSRANKVCESVGGTLHDQQNGDNNVYLLEGLGVGSFEKDCEDTEPENTQTCASGCGTQTRTVTCNRRTGTWETGDFEGDCPVQGEATQTCTQGVGTETRTFSCSGNTWVPNAWDTSACTCDPEEKPEATQTCTTGVGTETRSVTCKGTTWETGAWDTSSCTCDENTKPAVTQTCTTGVGTETRSVTCNGTTWETGAWDKSSCTCDPKTKPAESESCTYGGTKTRNVECDANSLTWKYGTWDESKCKCDTANEPSKSQNCSSGCGTQTRTNSCVNGQWQEGTWTACADKPATSQSCSDGCRTGTQTRSVTCQANGTWKTGTFGTCSVTKPATSQACTYGGTMTRTVTCKNSAWSTGTWNQSGCSCDSSSKPASSRSCTKGTGTETRSVSCSNGSWSTGSWNTSKCACDASSKPSNCDTVYNCTSGGGTYTLTCSCSGGVWVTAKTWNYEAGGTCNIPATSSEDGMDCYFDGSVPTCCPKQYRAGLEQPCYCVRWEDCWD